MDGIRGDWPLPGACRDLNRCDADRFSDGLHIQPDLDEDPALGREPLRPG